MTATLTSVLAVCLAALGALLFGLAAVRQHAAVRSTVGPGACGAAGTGKRSSAEPGEDPDDASGTRIRSWVTGQLASGLRLVRQPAWLLGAGQAGLGGALHMVALTLAPITLVQPVGVLAVPVTVVRSALARGRWPSRAQVAGTALSVLGVAALTVVLLVSTAQVAVLPVGTTLAVYVAAVVLTAVALALAVARAPAPLRCVGRAVVAASLFGLVSVLVRVVGQAVTTAPGHASGLVLTAVVGMAAALPLGIWSMQSAYVVGAPQVVICCLTLVDPVAAVLGGRVLLSDGSAVGGVTLLAAAGCALAAAAGVVLLAREYPETPAAAPPDGRPGGASPAAPTAARTHDDGLLRLGKA